MQSDREEVSGSRGGGGGDKTIAGGGIGPVGLPPQSDLGVSGDLEPSEGT